jgi:hypothetical protein
MEKWILRVLVFVMLAVGVWAVVGSVDDIKRYVRIKRM